MANNPPPSISEILQHVGTSRPRPDLFPPGNGGKYVEFVIPGEGTALVILYPDAHPPIAPRLVSWTSVKVTSPAAAAPGAPASGKDGKPDDKPKKDKEKEKEKPKSTAEKLAKESGLKAVADEVVGKKPRPVGSGTFVDKDGKTVRFDLVEVNGTVYMVPPNSEGKDSDWVRDNQWRHWESTSEAYAWAKDKTTESTKSVAGERKVQPPTGNGWHSDGKSTATRPLFTNGKQTGYQVWKDGKIVETQGYGTWNDTVAQRGPGIPPLVGVLDTAAELAAKRRAEEAARLVAEKKRKEEEEARQRAALLAAQQPTPAPEPVSRTGGASETVVRPGQMPLKFSTNMVAIANSAGAAGLNENNVVGVANARTDEKDKIFKMQDGRYLRYDAQTGKVSPAGRWDNSNLVASSSPRIVDDWWRDELGRQPEKPKATTKPTSPLGSIQAGPTGAYEHGRGQPPGTVVAPSATDKLDPAIQAAINSRSAETKAARDPSKPAWHQNENWVASPDQGTAAIAGLNLPSGVTVLETRPGKEGRAIYRLNNATYVAMDPTDPNAKPQYAGWWNKDEWESSQHGTVVPPATAINTPEGTKTLEQIDREVDAAMQKAGISPPVDPTAPAAQFPNVPEPVIPPEVAPAAPTSGVAVTSGQPGGPVSTYQYDKPANVPAWQTKIDPELGGIGGNDISKHGQALAVRDSKDGTKLIVQMSDGSFQSVNKSTGTVAGAGTWGDSKGGGTSVAGISNPTPAAPAASPSNSSLVITSPLPPQPETPVVNLGVTDPTQTAGSQSPLSNLPPVTPADTLSGLNPPVSETPGILKRGRWFEM